MRFFLTFLLIAVALSAEVKRFVVAHEQAVGELQTTLQAGNEAAKVAEAKARFEAREFALAAFSQLTIAQSSFSAGEIERILAAAIKLDTIYKDGFLLRDAQYVRATAEVLADTYALEDEAREILAARSAAQGSAIVKPAPPPSAPAKSAEKASKTEEKREETFGEKHFGLRLGEERSEVIDRLRAAGAKFSERRARTARINLAAFLPLEKYGEIKEATLFFDASKKLCEIQANWFDAGSGFAALKNALDSEYGAGKEELSGLFKASYKYAGGEANALLSRDTFGIESGHKTSLS
ncbi:MAG: hypothetical protein LBU73_07805, partial [Helicobacteraceae bacterium]|nr:hypothetical protein [Helicobacteraceae bacterium]